MKRFILMLAVVMLAVLGVNAQTEKTLKGKLTNVQMNNNNYADVEGVTLQPYLYSLLRKKPRRPTT